ncbi:MAG: hypothetical protein ABIF18_02250 [archaeon]
MILSRFNSRATVGVDDTIKWIIYIAILASAGFAVKMIVSKVIG